MQVLRRMMVVLGAALALSSCASTVAVESQSKPQDRRQARLYFLRESTVVAVIAAPTIRINGEEVGSLSTGSFFFVDRPAGRYEILVEQPLAPGRFVADVTVAPGGIYYFEVGPNPLRGVALPSLAGNVGTVIPAREASGYFQFNAVDQVPGRQLVAKLKS
jgi:hypothetical protein